MHHPFTPVVAAWGCLLCSSFGATGPLGAHDVGYTSRLWLQLHWVTLELLLKDGPGIEIIARLLFYMWLAALPDRGDHAVLRLVLIVWFTSLLEFCKWVSQMIL